MTYQTIAASIPNQKGLRLATEIYKPESKGKMPVVLLFHGFTGYKENPALVDIAQRLAENGIVSVRFTASGFGDSEGTLQDDYRFSNYLSDAESVYTYVSNLPYVDTARLGVYGHSMGGKLAVLFARDHVVKAFCIVSTPVTFRRTSYAKLLPDWKRNGYFEKVSGRDGKTIRIPYAYIADVEQQKFNVLTAARRTKVLHTLVIAGAADTEVPWEETKKIFDALICLKEWILIDTLPHKYGHLPPLFPIVNQPIASFFQQNL
ncbi:MAG TPA: alpha/beta fold hydrolase [Patescibacteria group bacterium]|nr:alpha/beta fold hydrolase [Patescibacteria group bacterium]